MELELTPIWDKVFPHSDAVEHEKVVFHNRYGIELAADLYRPKSVVPGANHTDLYDNYDFIPFDRIQGFFEASLNGR